MEIDIPCRMRKQPIIRILFFIDGKLDKNIFCRILRKLNLARVC
jgi:hypothetical protein